MLPPLLPRLPPVTVNDSLLFYEDGELLSSGFKSQLSCLLAV